MKTKNRKEKKNRPVMVYSLSLFIILAIASVASAATVSVQPQTQNLAPGATFTFTVNVDSGSDTLSGANVELNYNTNVLVVNSIIKGSLLGSGSGILEVPDNDLTTPGIIKYGVARTASNPAVSVNGVYLTVNAQIKSGAPAGISLLDLTTVTLKKTASTNIADVTINDGQVNVTGGSGGGNNGGGGGANDEAMVFVSPQTQDKAPGATFSVNVNIDSGINTLSAAKIELNYNTNVLVVNSITKGSLLGSGSGILEAPDNDLTTPGTIKYGVARTASNPAVAVDGTFLTIAFQVKGVAPSGISLLDLSNVILKKNAATNIANTTVTDGQVNVSGTPLPAELKWKYISVPYQLNNSTVANVLNGIQYDGLFGFDPVNKVYVGGVTNFEPLKGYLIHMDISQDITNIERRSGQPQMPPALDVKKGWNLIGTTNPTAMDAETMLGAIDQGYYSIWNFDVSTQSFDKVGVNGKSGNIDATHVGTDVFMMQPKVGYWVWATQDTSLPAYSP